MVLLARYTDSERNVRVCIADTTHVGRDAYRRLQCSPIALNLISQAMTGALLLVSEFKVPGSISLRFEGPGPAGHITVEANSDGEARGFSGDLSVDIDPPQDCSWFDSAIGPGQLTVRKRLSTTQQIFSSSVETEQGGVASNLSRYLLQSDQIASAMSLTARLDAHQGIAAAGGILVQALPQANEHILVILEDRLVQLGQMNERFGTANCFEDMANHLLEDLNLVELAQTPTSYRCHCSRQRVAQILKSLPDKDLAELVESAEDVTLNCQFCTKPYVFSCSEITTMVRDSSRD